MLISHETSSAAEIASISTLKLDNIQLIESNTEGIFSDGLYKRIPNVCKYTLSNEIYEDIDGNNYENKGVPSDISLNYPK